MNEWLVNIGLNHYLVLSAILFSFGALGVLIRRNTIVVLMSVELMLNAVNLTVLSFSYFRNILEGNVFVFFVMTIAAAEAAVGLAILVSVFKQFKEVNIRFFEHLKG